MAFTRVVGPGIHTQANVHSHNIQSTGIITATKFDGPFDSLNVTGVATVTGNLKVGGVLTYEDVTNVDAIGIITARDGIFLPDNKKLELGNAAGSGDLQIFHDSSNSYIENSTNSLFIRSDSLQLYKKSSSERYIVCSSDAAVKLFYDNDLKLETTNTGAKVTGTLAGASEVGIQSGGVQIGAGITQLNFI